MDCVKRAALCGLLVLAFAASQPSEALVLDDQPPNGVSESSAWATLITPDPGYKPLLYVASPVWQTSKKMCKISKDVVS
jgi:hypothetical protein